MTMVTLYLPEETMEQALQAASVLQRSAEEVLTDMLSALLPPMHDIPTEIRAELTRMTWLSSIVGHRS